MIAEWLQQRLSSCPRIGLGELDAAAALAHRVDTKYLVAQPHLAEVVDRLADAHAVLAIDGVSGFSYRSTYLDTPELVSFHDHRRGRRLRWKLRTRVYEDSGRTRLEVKLKDGRGATDKHAIVLPAPVPGVPQQSAAFLAEVLAARYRVAAPTALVATLVTRHHRTTLADPEHGARVTIDTDLAFAGGTGSARLRPDVVLIETKSARGRSVADLALRRAGARPVAVSKYCAGMALTHPELPDQPWRPLLRRHFTHQTLKAAAA
jgi:hypothetical protein